MTRSAGRTGRAWRAVAADVYATERACWLCGWVVDQTLPRGHPLSRTADHLVQLRHGGAPTDRANLRLAHMLCNARRGGLLHALTPDRCACRLGRPCGHPTPDARRGMITVDPAEV